jgi:hypothetical protein
MHYMTVEICDIRTFHQVVGDEGLEMMAKKICNTLRWHQNG